MNEPHRFGFRLVLFALACILGLQSIWLLIPELIRPGIDSLPTDAEAARHAVPARAHAVLAANMGIMLGDLWARSAFTYADLLWANRNLSPALSKELDQAHAQLDKSLSFAPIDTSAWLLLAGLASRFHLPNTRPLEALKMSYYTGPNDAALSSLRLQIAVDLQALSDPDMQLFVRQDLQSICCREPKQLNPAVLEAYESASSSGKQFIEQTLGDMDPAYLKTLLAAAPKK